MGIMGKYLAVDFATVSAVFSGDKGDNPME
jgi:hypothetical protein